MLISRLRSQGGEATLFNGEGVMRLESGARQMVCDEIHQMATFTCNHHGGIVHVPPKADVNFVGFCRICMKPICNQPECQACVPFEKKLEAAERRQDTLRSYGF